MERPTLILQECTGGGVDVALDLVDVHVAGVGRVSADAMVLLDQGVEDIRKHLVLWILQ